MLKKETPYGHKRRGIMGLMTGFKLRNLKKSKTGDQQQQTEEGVGRKRIFARGRGMGTWSVTSKPEYPRKESVKEGELFERTPSGKKLTFRTCGG